MNQDWSILKGRPRCKYCENAGYELHEKTIDGHIYSFAYKCRDVECLAAEIKAPPNYPRYEPHISVVRGHNHEL